MIRIVGLDLSLSATGIAPPGEPPRTITTKLHDVRRLDFICDAIAEVAKDCDVAVIEQYAFSRHDAHAHAIGELGGCVRLDLYRLGVEYAEPSVQSLKKFATGKGNASKPEVLIAARERFGYEGASFDEAEALVLREMAALHYDWDRQAPFAYMQEVLHKTAWPVLPASVMRA